MSGEDLGEGPADPDAVPASEPAAAQPAAEAPPNGSAEGLAGPGAPPVAAGDAAQEGTALQASLLCGEAQAEAHAGAGDVAAGSNPGADAGDGEPAAKRQRTKEPLVAGAPGGAGAEPGAPPGGAAGEGLGDRAAAGGPPDERSGSPAGPSDSFHSALSKGASCLLQEGMPPADSYMRLSHSTQIVQLCRSQKIFVPWVWDDGRRHKEKVMRM